MEGVLEHAGRLVPVVDLRRRFGVDAPAPSAQSRLLILSTQGEWVGALVDQVLDIRAVAPGDIAPPPAVVRGIAGEYLRGVVRRGDVLVVVLDVERLFASSERLDLATATAPALDAQAGGA
jgi:purine-binding chemotaxis protein CheW